MARAALDWSIQHLADKAEVGRNTITRYERGGDARVSSVNTIRRTLEVAGIRFIERDRNGGPGVRLVDPELDFGALPSID